MRLHWNWTGQCFALDRTLDSILHRSRTAEHWAEEQNFRRKKDILSARGVEIETRLRANCNSHVKNRRTTGGERKSLFWELQLYAMEKGPFLFELHVV